MVSRATWETVENSPDVGLGRQTSAGYLADPKHLVFTLARYKFVAKMLHGQGRVLEIGCGDGFGTPIVAQVVGEVVGLDNAPEALASRPSAEPPFPGKLSFRLHDAVAGPVADRPFDAVFSLDVLEHLAPEQESAFMTNILASLGDIGLCLVGTPNRTAAAYQSPPSMRDHINLKTQDELRALLAKYFHYVMMFGMNDEVVHTGYGPMCHYLFGIGLHPRKI